MVDDGDGWEFFREGDRRARKPHRCDECGRTIDAGEVYRFGSGLTDGWFSQWKTCHQCVQACRWLNKVCHGYLINAAEEDLGHHIRGEEEGELSSSHLVRLVRWMAYDWRDRSGRLRTVEEVREVADRAIAVYQAKYDRAVA